MVRMVNFMFCILRAIKKVLLGATLEERRKKKKPPNIVKYLRGKDYPSLRMTEV